MKRRQCAQCPWLTSVDVRRDVPNYRPDKHQDTLRNTIKSGAASIGPTLNIMACHKSRDGAEIPCVGWLHHQLGAGNNIGLRLAAMRDPTLGDYELIGEQLLRGHDTAG